jgi:transcription initiation factor TFIIH subunit 1
MCFEGSFLAEIKPVTDGCNGFKYNLTAEVIESVFKVYPAVKKKHVECVPNKLSESEFWTKFFQSHYFHRDRITTGIKDVFVECGKIDDTNLKKDIRRNLNDPLLNLSKFGDNNIEEGFCSSSTIDQKADNGGNIVHQSIIKRFNQHSLMILKTCEKKVDEELKPDGVEKGEKKVNGTPDGTNKRQKHEEVEVSSTPEQIQALKRQRISEKIEYTDLGSTSENLSDKSASQSANINLEKLERYLYGPMPSSHKGNVANNHHKNSEHSLESIDYILRKKVSDLGQRIPHNKLISPAAAVNALGELSPGGLLMSGYRDQNLSQFIPPEIERELNNLYLSASELLKEFWLCFPPINSDLETKAFKMHETLQRFNSAKVKSFEDRISPIGSQILSHLNLLIETAFRKFNSWQERRGNKLK